MLKACKAEDLAPVSTLVFISEIPNSGKATNSRQPITAAARSLTFFLFSYFSPGIICLTNEVDFTLLFPLFPVNYANDDKFLDGLITDHDYQLRQFYPCLIRQFYQLL